MRLKPMMLLALASGCGLIAMFLFQQATKGNSQPVVEEKIEVLVATVEIPPGHALNEENSEFREYPISVIPENSITLPEEFEGNAVKARTFAGDFITLDKLTTDKSPSSEIPAGMVAIGIPVDTTMTSSGLLLPGDKVDVLVTFTMRGQFGAGKVIKTVLEFVEVFATDRTLEADTSAGERKVKTVTLLVTPDQAMLVKLAEDVGQLHLAMRSKDDSIPRTTESNRFDPSLLSDFYNDDDEETADEEDGDDNDADEEGDEDIDDLDAFLDEAIDETPTETAQPVLEDLTPVTWTIEIFSGDERRVEEVPIPEAELEAARKKAGKSGNPIVNGFRNLFGGSTESKKPAAVEDGVSTNDDVGAEG